MNGEVARRKARFRRRVLDARKRLSAQTRLEAATQITAGLLGLGELREASTVLGYAAFGSEAGIDAWLRARLDGGSTVALPFVDGPTLSAARVTDIDDLRPGWRGVREPSPAHRVPLDPASLEGVVVPGVAFDRRGHRLGYGGGHFDRFLREVKPGRPVVGVAFSVQVVADVPVQRHDRRVDFVVTERGVLQCW